MISLTGKSYKIIFLRSQSKVLNLAETFSNEELFTKGAYKWVGGSTLVPIL